LPVGQIGLISDPVTLASLIKRLKIARAKKTISRGRSSRFGSSSPARENILLSFFPKLMATCICPASARGVRVVTNVRRDAMDAGGVGATSDMAADGEIVWSWRSDAGAKIAKTLQASRERRWQPSMVTGEITYKP
jgi:hypothetical protein